MRKSEEITGLVKLRCAFAIVIKSCDECGDSKGANATTLSVFLLYLCDEPGHVLHRHGILEVESIALGLNTRLIHKEVFVSVKKENEGNTS